MDSPQDYEALYLSASGFISQAKNPIEKIISWYLMERNFFSVRVKEVTNAAFRCVKEYEPRYSEKGILIPPTSCKNPFDCYPILGAVSGNFVLGYGELADAILSFFMDCPEFNLQFTRGLVSDTFPFLVVAFQSEVQSFYSDYIKTLSLSDSERNDLLENLLMHYVISENILDSEYNSKIFKDCKKEMFNGASTEANA